MSHPVASHKSISIADQSTPSEKAARHVKLVLSAKGERIFFLIGIRTHFPLFEPI
jgi:hypothetical protein